MAGRALPSVLLMTNNHVLRSALEAVEAFAELDYEEDKTPFEVSLRPSEFFLTCEELDYTLVAVDESELRGRQPVPLRAGLGVGVGAVVTVTQHPGGRMKMAANQVVKEVCPPFVRYVLDTEYGSSGSPVFMNMSSGMEVVAVHHQRSPKDAANQGVLLAVILDDVKKKLGGMPRAAVERPEPRQPEPEPEPEPEPDADGGEGEESGMQPASRYNQCYRAATSFGSNYSVVLMRRSDGFGLRLACDNLSQTVTVSEVLGAVVAGERPGELYPMVGDVVLELEGVGGRRRRDTAGDWLNRFGGRVDGAGAEGLKSALLACAELKRVRWYFHRPSSNAQRADGSTFQRRPSSSGSGNGGIPAVRERAWKASHSPRTGEEVERERLSWGWQT